MDSYGRETRVKSQEGGLCVSRMKHPSDPDLLPLRFRATGRMPVRRVFLAILAAFFTLSCAPARSAESVLFIRSADFYPSGAKFTFQASSDGNFSFTLPGAFSQDSVRCLTMDSLSSFKVETFPVMETIPAALVPLEKKAEAAQKSVDILEGRGAALSSTLGMITAPFPQSGGAKIDDSVLAGYIAYLTDALKLRLDLEAQRVDVNAALLQAQKALKDARDELEAERARLEAKKPFNSGIALRVSGTTQAPAALLFEAYTPSAGWNVVYEMGMNSATGAIRAKMNAVARQRTGMDVSGNLSFHTRQPSFAVRPPEVSPLTVALSSPRSNATDASFAPKIMAGAPDAMEMFDEAAEGSASMSQEPQAISTLANVTVNAAGKIDGDGNAARVTLGSFNMKSVPVLISIPEQSKEAWIVASVDEFPQAFLPGTAELAVDGASTGTAMIPDLPGAIQIPFGMAAKISSKKTPYVSTQGSSWAIIKGVREDAYVIEITSRMDRDVEIELRDRIPFPTVDRVTVDVKKIDPEPQERDKENRLLWKLSLKPGETKKITVEYSIRYPNGETLIFR